MMALVNDDTLVVIGGKGQIFCEKYTISLNNWRKIPILPEERYQGSLLVYLKESNLYLFGGLTNGKFNTSILFLNFRSIGGWDKILLKGNDNLLKRNNSLTFLLEGTKDDIFICGGETDSNNNNDYIVHYDPKNKKIKKKFINSNICNSKFKNQSIIDFDGKYYSFVDSDENIYIIEKKNFGIKLFLK